MVMFDVNYGELGRREFTIRFGIIRSTDPVNMRMKVEMCDSPGTIVDIYYQNMVQPILAEGTSTVKGWGIYSIPVGNVGSIAVIIFHKNEFPLILGYMASHYKRGIINGTLDKISEGEIKIKSYKQSEIYFDNTGNIKIKATGNITMTVEGNSDITTTTGNVLLNGSNGVVLAPGLPPGSAITNVNQLQVATTVKGR